MSPLLGACVHLAHWLLPWIVALTVSSGIAYAMNRVLLTQESPQGEPPAYVCEFGEHLQRLYDRSDHCAQDAAGSQWGRSGHTTSPVDNP
jgi:hypothetical protein